MLLQHITKPDTTICAVFAFHGDDVVVYNIDYNQLIRHYNQCSFPFFDMYIISGIDTLTDF
jgi:hypothetical protein